MKANMRILLCLLLGLSVSTAWAQITSYGNFKVSEQELIYQKIFTQDSITIEKLAAFYGAQAWASNVQTSGNEVTFDMNELRVDYKKFQFSQVAVPPVIQTGKYTGKVAVSTKDGKYRVTVRSIEFTGDVGYKKVTEKDKLTNYACRNSGTVISQDWTKPNTLGLLDKAFTDNLQFVEAVKKKDKDDW
jgi:hypothetical protein